MSNAESTLNDMRIDDRFMRNVAAWERIAPRQAQRGMTPPQLDTALVNVLQAQGFLPLYSHQSEGIGAALNGNNTVIVTGTASGKTLCYTVPVLQSVYRDPTARALWLFPTKALAQDQLSSFQRLSNSLEQSTGVQVTAAVYDGDTPKSQRANIRTEANVILSNPDMLHMGILPHHPKWIDLFQNLRYVVLDELHVYRGVFGSHVANVLRRLSRICEFYGSQPQFICTSATIANPKELAENLIDQQVTLVDTDGSPQPEKHFVLYNPPLLENDTGLRRAYTLETKNIVGRFLMDDVQTAVFARSRVTTELMLSYIHGLAAEIGLAPELVRGYRGGYLATERREIEAGLRSGKIRSVVATNALELGVDIGQLGAVVIAGYPGTIAGLWQQAGRSGRRGETAGIVFVASGAPLDQYIAMNPRFVFETSPEHGLINPDNLAILFNHIRCALFELPFEENEGFGPLDDIDEFLELLEENQEVHRPEREGESSYWIGQSYPAQSVSLRTAGDDRVLIHEMGQDEAIVIGEIDAEIAPQQVHRGAVYVHDAKQFIVAEFDYEQKIAYVKPADLDYYTRAHEDTKLEVLDVYDADESGLARKAHGEILVTSTPVGYRKIKLYTHEVLGYGQIDLPSRQYETTAYWLWLADDVCRNLERQGVFLRPNDYGPNWDQQRKAAKRRDAHTCRKCAKPEPVDGIKHHVHHIKPFRTFGYIPGENANYIQANVLENLLTLCPACHSQLETAERTALAGISHAIGNLAPLYLMCDPGDISTEHEMRSKETGAPTVTVFDKSPGGVGFSTRLYELHDDLLEGVLELVENCPCQHGCPACVGPVIVEQDVGTLGLKQATMMVARALG